MWTFLADSIKHRLANVVYFALHIRYKVYDAFSFLSLCIFAQICSTASWSMEVIEENKVVMFVSQCKLEYVGGHLYKKVYWWLEPYVR